jgi:hypothetical protein
VWFHTFFVWFPGSNFAGNPARVAEMKLLVVGSNPLVRRMVLNVVADLASDIRECAIAAEAIAAYAGDSPDFVWPMQTAPAQPALHKPLHKSGPT